MLDLVTGFVIIILTIIFGGLTIYASLRGAPFAPTRVKVVEKAFDYIKLSPTDHFIDLGAGDGRLLRAAAKRGSSAHGYELTLPVWLIGWLLCLPFPKIRLKFKNFYTADLSRATVVFTFLLPDNMPRIVQLLKTKTSSQARYFLSYVFELPGYQPEHIVELPRQGQVYIYKLPLSDKS